MKNLTKYALDGIRLQNEELFIKRVYEIIERYDVLDMVLNGVPVKVKIDNENILIEYINDTVNNISNIKVSDVSINKDFEIVVHFSYNQKRFYNNHQDADNKNWKNYKYAEDETYNIPVEFETNDIIYINKDNIEKVGLKLELL